MSPDELARVLDTAECGSCTEIGLVLVEVDGKRLVVKEVRLEDASEGGPYESHPGLNLVLEVS